mmetsp:Transcript_43914/g.70600  ORF Transcript_43914/g.70600 Transcript_43914/m.70600 type:complete len:298 (-) Transcript_43914:734-1627(-)|eukprot:jgi/Bigna1/90671/estExt_fgenesh1_pg.C_760046
MDLETQLHVSDDTWDIDDDLITDSELDFNKLPDLDHLLGPTMNDSFGDGRAASSSEKEQDGDSEMLSLQDPPSNKFLSAFKDSKLHEQQDSQHCPPFAGRSEWQSIHTELKKDLRVGNFALKVLSKEVWWCDAVYSIFGTTPKQALPSLELFAKMVHPMDKDVVFFLMDRAIRQAVPFEITHRIRLEDGTVKWCRFMCRVQYDSRTRRVDKLVGTIQDITQWSNSVKNMAKKAEKKNKPAAGSDGGRSAGTDDKQRGGGGGQKTGAAAALAAQMIHQPPVLLDDDAQFQEDATCSIQ